jgi:hypothetical protein
MQLGLSLTQANSSLFLVMFCAERKTSPGTTKKVPYCCRQINKEANVLAVCVWARMFNYFASRNERNMPPMR